MNMGLGYDSAEGRALCGALTAIMTGVAYATSAEMAARTGRLPGYARNRDHMLRVIRNHRAAAWGTGDYEALNVPPVALDHANCPDQAWSRWRNRLGRGAGPWANSTATATRRPPSSPPPAPSAW
jgi:ribonucleoside-diphosphate reductase alpha chain